MTAEYYHRASDSIVYQEVAKEYDTQVLAKLPIDPAKAAAADAGEFYGTDHSAFTAAAEALK